MYNHCRSSQTGPISGMATRRDARAPRLRMRVGFAAVLVAGVALTSRGGAQTIAARPNAAPLDTTIVRPVVLAVSGGISLGSYQAGVNWALLQFFRLTENPAFADTFSSTDSGDVHIRRRF